MSNALNRQIRLVSRPVGLPKASDFELTVEPLPELEPGEVLVRAHYISLDPAMRGWMNESEASYIRPVGLGDVMRAASIGRVVASRHRGCEVGEFVVGMLGAQEFGVGKGEHMLRVSPEVAPLPTLLGGLGGNGLTAYFGLLDVGRPEPRETVLVSGAAGGVGSVVGQIAKIVGCRAVGIAGGPEKCRYLTEELGFDAAIDYKNEDVRGAIKERCPDGVDVFFDNVGGEVLDHALSRLNFRARVVICGAISQYNNEGAWRGPQNYMNLLVKRARMEGFLTFDFADRYPEAATQLIEWMSEGRLVFREHVVEGLERFHEALLLLFSGEKLGKLVLKVD